ncbi:MAG: tetratricopeptide repeat protein [Nitrosarchaeum sp.]
MVGLFSKAPKDPKAKSLFQKRKELRKLIKQKQHDAALKLGLEILETTDEQNVLFIVGGIYYMKEKYSTAISYFEKALNIGSYDVEVLILKANSHYFLGEPKRAIQCCNKIKEIDPKNKAVSELLSKIESKT